MCNGVITVNQINKMPLEQKVIQRKIIATTSVYLSRDDFQIITGLRRKMSNELFNAIQIQVNSDLKKNGLEINPYPNLIPSEKAFGYLKQALGITKQSLIDDYCNFIK